MKTRLRLRLATFVSIGCLVGNFGCDSTSPTAAYSSGDLSAEPKMPFSLVYSGSEINNETFVAINPAHPDQIAVSWQQPVRVSVSDDGGASWHVAWRAPTRQDFFTSDPVIRFDSAGSLYVVFLDFARLHDSRQLGSGADANGIYLERSDDGGLTWTTPRTTIVEHPQNNPGLFEDKPAFAVGRVAGSDRISVHVAWTQFSPSASRIMYAHSENRGASFSTPQVISDFSGSPVDSTGVAEGTSVAIGPDGTVYVVWSDARGIWLDSSKDGGRSWGTDVLIANAKDMFFRVPFVFRSNGFPTIAVDPRTGRIFVAWVQEHNFRYVPILAFSDTHGATWSAPKPIVDDVSSPTDRFFASVAVDPVTGLTAIAYYRTELLGYYSFTLATSVDGGNTFTERNWHTPLVAPAGGFIGDYIGIDARNGSVQAAWTGATLDPSSNKLVTDIWLGTALF